MAHQVEDESILGTGITTRHIETFGRKVTTTANHLIGPLSESSNNAYHTAMHDIHRELRRPRLQRSVFSFAQNSPSELVRAKLSTAEIQHRALAHIPDELLRELPEDDNTYSLFQGFQASMPDVEEDEHRKKHRRHDSRGWLLEDSKELKGTSGLEKARKDRDRATHKLEMLGVRKNMFSAEILEIDKKVANLHTMRKMVLDRLSALEDEELKVEQDIFELDGNVEELQEQLEEQAEAAKLATPLTEAASEVAGEDDVATPSASETFMSQSIFEKLPSPKSKRKGMNRRLTMPIRHGHFQPGTNVRTIPAHNDMITAMDFDAPFGTMVSAALDDTLRVWDLNTGRCLGLLEGHRASVRCLHMEDSLVASGSIDASIRLWDLGRADYPVSDSTFINKSELNEEDGDGSFEDAQESHDTGPEPPSASSMADCPIFALEAHVAEITALHFHKDTLISGSADKTLRQWDLTTGRCVQTLDVLWAAAQAAASINPSDKGKWRTSTRLPDASADFVGAVQCFDAALACGTADGMVRLWDLRSGQVSRSLVGHTGPVTCLQFDDAHMVTGSLDRSIRVRALGTSIVATQS